MVMLDAVCPAIRAVGASGMWLTGIYSTMNYCRVTDTLTGQDAAPIGACGFAVGLAFGQIFPWEDEELLCRCLG
jgi:hypothetical protein